MQSQPQHWAHMTQDDEKTETKKMSNTDTTKKPEVNPGVPEGQVLPVSKFLH